MLKDFQVRNLFSCPFSHCTFTSPTFVVNCSWIILLSWLEEFNWRISSDAKSWCKLLILSCINLGNLDLAFQWSSKWSPLRSQILAMSTPRGIELDEPSVLITIHKLVKIISCQNNNIFFIHVTRISAMRVSRTSRMTSSADSLVGNLKIIEKSTFLNSANMKLMIPVAVLSPE